jgi:FMN phosphatase YigB (HAD superfamily)
METTLALDIGNVLCYLDMDIFINAFEKYSGKRDGIEFLNHIQAMQDVNMTTVEMSLIYKYSSLKEDDKKLNELLTAWNNTVQPCDEMMNLIQELKSDGIKIAILSNMGPEHLFHLKKIAPEIFKNTIHHISCEVGARKPTKLFYQSFLLDNDNFIGCLYIDDIEENRKVGKQYGFKSYDFNLEKFKQLTKFSQKKQLDSIKSLLFSRAG